MNLLDLPAALDDPIDALLVFHRHIERHLATLGRLSAAIEADGHGAHTIGAAAAILAFFSEAVPTHHAQEERYLLPLLGSRLVDASERERFEDLRTGLEADHGQMNAAWRYLRRPLEGLAEGVKRELPDDLVSYFRALFAIHIPAEEAGLHRLAHRVLQRRDRSLLAQRIGTRFADPR